MKPGAISGLAISDHLRLCRPGVALFAAFSGLGGCVLAMPHGMLIPLCVFAGLVLLAAGVSGINQCQEHATDALMPRTKKRPIPSGRMTSLHAFVFSLFLSGAGLAILGAGCGFLAAFLGLFAALWYNGVYTLLKRVSAFAAIPGALTGALPPAIGWTAGGGSLLDPSIGALCIFFAIWQVPHFWLLLLRYGNEYAAAGLPTLSTALGKGQLSRIVFLWMTATAVSALVLGFFGFAQSPHIRAALLAASAWLVLQGLRLILSRGDACRPVFGWINAFMILVMSLLAADRMFASLGMQKLLAVLATAIL